MRVFVGICMCVGDNTRITCGVRRTLYAVHRMYTVRRTVYTFIHTSVKHLRAIRHAHFCIFSINDHTPSAIRCNIYCFTRSRLLLFSRHD